MRQPDRNRYLRAVHHVESEEVPFLEIEFDITVAEKLLGRPLPKVRSYELPARDLVDLHIRAGGDMVYLANLWELGRKHVVDAHGRKQYVDGTIKTRRDLALVRQPDLDQVRRRIEEVLEALQDTGLGLIYRPNQAAFLVMTAIGYEDYYLYLKTDPDFIRELQKRVADYCRKELEVALGYPVDVVQASTVFCSSYGPLVSREVVEEFEYPLLREQVRTIKENGRVAMLHADGLVEEFIPEFIEMGVDVIHPLEPCDGQQDIYRIKQRYGDRVALHGNVDLAGVLVFGTPEEVTRDVEEHISRLAAGGGYVCGSSHDITEAVPLENLFAMRDAAHAFRFRGGR